MERKENKIVKTAFFMIVITLASKVLGMLRDVLLASHYGTSAAEVAYDTASRLPILIFDFVIGGVVTASFIPVFNELLVKKGKKEALDFANLYVNVILVITVLLSIVGVVFAGPLVKLLAPDLDSEISSLAVSLTRIMFPMIIFTGLAFSFVGILQSFEKFLLPAMISLISNLIMVSYFVLLDSKFGIYGLALAMLCGWGSQAFVQIPAVAKEGLIYRPTFRFSSPYLIKSLKMALPILVSSWVQPFCNLINTRFASSIENGSGISAIGYANRLYIIIVGVFTFVATNLIFPYFSKAQAKGDSSEGDKLTKMSIFAILLIILPITVGIFVLSKPLVSLIYERGEFGSDGVRMTAEALSFFAIGMPFYAVNEIYTKRFFAEQKAIPPMVTAIASIVLDVVIVSLLAPRFGIIGIALSSSVAVLVNVLLNGFLRRRGGEKILSVRDAFNILKMTLSALAMGAVVYLLNLSLSGGLVTLCVSVAVGIITYFLLCLLLRESLVSGIVSKAVKRGRA